jgi:hypothetical protein
MTPGTLQIIQSPKTRRQPRPGECIFTMWGRDSHGVEHVVDRVVCAASARKGAYTSLFYLTPACMSGAFAGHFIRTDTGWNLRNTLNKRLCPRCRMILAQRQWAYEEERANR